jgi:hypothetical protein
MPVGRVFTSPRRLILHALERKKLVTTIPNDPVRFETFGPHEDVIVQSSPAVDNTIKSVLPRRHRHYDARAAVWRVNPGCLTKLVVAWAAAGYHIEGTTPGGAK